MRFERSDADWPAVGPAADESGGGEDEEGSGGSTCVCKSDGSEESEDDASEVAPVLGACEAEGCRGAATGDASPETTGSGGSGAEGEDESETGSEEADRASVSGESWATERDEDAGRVAGRRRPSMPTTRSGNLQLVVS